MEALAEKMRVHLKRDDCNDQIILGKRGDVHKGSLNRHYGYYVSIMYETARKFRIELAKAVAIGGEITQEGDTEAVVFFPRNLAIDHARQIRSIIHARRIRDMSEEAKLAGAARLKQYRESKLST